MSPYHFARLFTQATGQSPHQFIMRCRIDAAKKMLSESQRSIADIAAEVGYKNQSYFSTRFAQLAGMPPVAFRACH
jgi:AraC family transcriptional regulator